MHLCCRRVALTLLVVVVSLSAVLGQPPAFDDPQPQQYLLTARASEIDRRTRAHPEIDFLIETADGKPADLQQASVDTRVAPQGKLVIWLMGHNQPLFDRWNNYGLHAMRVHYANRWFSIGIGVCTSRPHDFWLPSPRFGAKPGEKGARVKCVDTNALWKSRTSARREPIRLGNCEGSSLQ